MSRKIRRFGKPKRPVHTGAVQFGHELPGMYLSNADAIALAEAIEEICRPLDGKTMSVSLSMRIGDLRRLAGTISDHVDVAPFQF